MRSEPAVRRGVCDSMAHSDSNDRRDDGRDISRLIRLAHGHPLAWQIALAQSRVAEPKDSAALRHLLAEHYLAQITHELVEEVAYCSLLLQELGRQGPPLAGGIAMVRPFVLDSDGRQLIIDGVRHPLTALELRLMQHLFANEGVALSRDELLDAAWGPDYEIGSNVVDVVVRRLRKKMGKRADAIETIVGYGYRFGVPKA